MLLREMLSFPLSVQRERRKCGATVVSPADNGAKMLFVWRSVNPVSVGGKNPENQWRNLQTPQLGPCRRLSASLRTILTL